MSVSWPDLDNISVFDSGKSHFSKYATLFEVVIAKIKPTYFKGRSKHETSSALAFTFLFFNHREQPLWHLRCSRSNFNVLVVTLIKIG